MCQKKVKNEPGVTLRHNFAFARTSSLLSPSEYRIVKFESNMNGSLISNMYRAIVMILLSYISSYGA